MIRVLVMIAVAGFVLSVGSLSAAVAIGGPDALARGGWSLVDGGNDWSWPHGRFRHDRDGRWADGGGPTTTRTLTWSGADRLDVDVTADVRYIQTPGGPGTVEVTGPTRALERLEIVGDTLRYEHGRRRFGYPKLTVVVRAPNIAAFDISGISSLDVEGYKQPRLSLDVSGEAEVTVAGEADDLSLDISGDGEADLGALKTKRANVDASGSSDATIAPSELARLDVSGMGDIRLLTRPGRLETDISGAGKVRQDDGDTYERGSSTQSSPTPSPTPSPSPSPSPKPAKT